MGRGRDFSTLLRIKGAAIAGKTVAPLLGPGFAIESERAGNAVLAVCAGPAGSLTARPRLSTRLRLLSTLPRPTYGSYAARKSSPSLLSSPVFDFPHASPYARSFEKKNPWLREKKATIVHRVNAVMCSASVSLKRYPPLTTLVREICREYPRLTVALDGARLSR